LVSHALRTVEELCNDAILLDHGRLIAHGSPHDVIAQYSEGSAVGEAALEDL
jgi:ABC-type polysaccharide/polyol phosphate transport system ATPase subunit